MKHLIGTEQKKFYNDNGYLIVNNLFSNDEIHNLISSLELHVDNDYNNFLNPDRYEYLIIQELEDLINMKTISEKLDYLKSCKNTSTLVRNLLRDSRIVSILETLYDDEIVGLSTHMIWKKPNTKYAKQAWRPHQDNSYGMNENGKLLTINLFLNDVDKNNGGLYNYPGSHKYGLLDCVSNKSYGNSYDPGNECIIPKECKKNDIIGKVGDLYIQHGNLVHGSYGNSTKDRMRGMYSATYIVKGEEYLSGFNANRKDIDLK